MAEPQQTLQPVIFDILTTDILDRLPKHQIFATGVIADNQHGIYKQGSGKMLRWVAVTGEIGDWAVYCLPETFSPYYIQNYGDKVIGPVGIRRVVKCDDAAFARYRY